VDNLFHAVSDEPTEPVGVNGRQERDTGDRHVRVREVEVVLYSSAEGLPLVVREACATNEFEGEFFADKPKTRAFLLKKRGGRKLRQRE